MAPMVFPQEEAYNPSDAGADNPKYLTVDGAIDIPVIGAQHRLFQSGTTLGPCTMVFQQEVPMVFQQEEP